MFSQGGNKRERIEALRVAFITQKLNLTPDESQKFWPVYNEYQDKLKSSRKEFKSQPTTFANDKEAQEYLGAELLLKQREFSLYKEYYEKIKKTILAISTAATAMPLNPSTPAINAIKRKVTTQLNIHTS